ncbi:T-lymphocyte surface antigen Ly-9-like isoform X5 [Oenanthe melanoleuca]|uniref:T-lymphocyte surface antigen Ly-9-like isoform X5 n=1 Tax=Oenanthe melanoleuca TaxID=2939378 RepID=UPI0024C13B15|nr:T-lymphocyte surface antigen Ly-9-like isoform X5 [Oenanthe melanoleuca]
MLLFLLFVVIIFCLVQCPGSSPFPQMPMDEFWIPLLTTLILLHQTRSASDTMEPTGAEGKFTTFYNYKSADGNAFRNIEINLLVSVPPKGLSTTIISKDKLEKSHAVSKKSHARAQTIYQSILDAGKYLKSNQTYTSNTVYRDLAESILTCEALNSGFCLHCSVPGIDLRKVSYTSKLREQQFYEVPEELNLNKSYLKDLGPLTCTARKAVSVKSTTITNLDVLCSGGNRHRGRPGDGPEGPEAV